MVSKLFLINCNCVNYTTEFIIAINISTLFNHCKLWIITLSESVKFLCYQLNYLDTDRKRSMVS